MSILLNFKKEYPSSTSIYKWSATIALIIFEFHNEQTKEVFNLTHSVVTLFSSFYVLSNYCGLYRWNCLSLNEDATSLRIKTVRHPSSISIVVEWKGVQPFELRMRACHNRWGTKRGVFMYLSFEESIPFPRILLVAAKGDIALTAAIAVVSTEFRLIMAATIVLG